MRKVFISYAEQNKRVVDQLVEHLRKLGYDPWTDSSLHGGQDWWEEILQRIADCDIFIPIISREALSSKACQLEFDWTEALGKPVLPVAVEPPPKALPRRIRCASSWTIPIRNPGTRRLGLRRSGTATGSAAAKPPTRAARCPTVVSERPHRPGITSGP